MSCRGTTQKDMNPSVLDDPKKKDLRGSDRGPGQRGLGRQTGKSFYLYDQKPCDGTRTQKPGKSSTCQGVPPLTESRMPHPGRWNIYEKAPLLFGDSSRRPRPPTRPLSHRGQTVVRPLSGPDGLEGSRPDPFSARRCPEDGGRVRVGGGRGRDFHPGSVGRPVLEVVS